MAGDDWDTIVIGAGVLGSATAYHLKRADPDARILLLDRNLGPALGNTRRSVALFRDLFTSSTNRALACSTVAFFDHVEEELGHSLGLKRFGYYWMMGESMLGSLRGPLEEQARRGLDLEFHDNDQVRSMLGEGMVLDPKSPAGTGPMEPVAGAVLAHNGGTLSPTRLARWYESRFREMGGAVEYGFHADRLVPGSVSGGDLHVWEEGRVTSVEGPAGRRRAKDYVVATGAWTPSLLDPLGVDSLVRPKTRQAFGLVGDGPSSLHGRNGFPGGRLPVLVLPSARVYLKPIHSQSMVLAGCADDFGRPFLLDEDPQPEGSFLDDQIRPVMEAYIPSMRGAEVKVSWAGQYHYNSVDGNPYVFRESNLTVVAGASGSGIMKSDAIGRVTAAAHMGDWEAELFDGRRMEVADLGIHGRRVEPEVLIL
ncbi:MAG: FAD-binding oxidoreductase [Thermoplasmata archaeon]|nr:MAG: FAD-binding oxidoreductase [Thermoplasmata archaeon]